MTLDELQHHYDDLLRDWSDATGVKQEAITMVAVSKSNLIALRAERKRTMGQVASIIREEFTQENKKLTDKALNFEVDAHPMTVSIEEKIAAAEQDVLTYGAQLDNARATLALLETRKEQLMMLSAVARDQVRATLLTT